MIELQGIAKNKKVEPAPNFEELFVFFLLQ